MMELELYKLLVTEDNDHGCEIAQELGWVSDDEFFVWISYSWIMEFIESIEEIFGSELFVDGEVNAVFKGDSICFNLSEMLSEYDLELEKIFPKDKYWH